MNAIRHFLPLLLALFCVSSPSAGQPGQMPAPVVSYTEARSFAVRETLDLTGSVASHRTSVVASSIAGVIVELRARDGQSVKRGATLARLRPDTFKLRLESARGQLTEAEARLKLAEGRRARAQGLWDEQVISRQALDDALTEVEAGAGRVAQLMADVARLEDEVARTVVRAPFTGVVVAEHTAVGEWVSAGDPVVELLDIGDLEVTLEVPEAFYKGLEVGAEAPVSIRALPGLEVPGRVRSVVPKADARARTFPVKVAIPNEDGRIGVGMLASVELPIGQAEEQVLVPKDAIVSRGSERWVYVVDKEGNTRRVDVRTGGSQGSWVAVGDALEAGTRVITQGNERLIPGVRVDAQPKEFELP